MTFRLVLAVVLTAFACIGHAQVNASLVAADTSIQPGRPFTVALRLRHDASWHTYWINPGTGIATTLGWRLPAGFAAGAIEWPAPHILKDADGNVTGHGYDGDLLLPVRITPPPALASGGSVKLRATAQWLMCAEFCIPGRADLELTLPVSSATPRPDASWAERLAVAERSLPRELSGWSVSAERDDETVSLRVKPVSTGAPRTPSELHFFSADNFIAYDQPQTIKSDGQGGYILTLHVSSDAPAAAPGKLLGVLTAENGWRPEGSPRGLLIEAPLGLPAAAATAEPGLLVTLALALAGGLILNLMPCVFPVLGIKVLGFVEQSHAQRHRVIAHGLLFSAGVVLSFWALAGTLAVLRSGGRELGWGFQLQSPAFVFALAAVMLAFGLNLSGVFELGTHATAIGSDLQMRGGYAGSFLAGVLATVVATPCSAPFLAPALGAALALPPTQSFAVFTAIAAGLCAPYLSLSIFPRAVRVLPRPGVWMVTFKQLMAFPLYATAACLVWVLAGQVSENGLLAALLGLTLISMGAWMYGRWTEPGASRSRVAFGAGGGLLLVAIGAVSGWPQPPAPAEMMWQKWSPSAVEALRAQGRPVYVDFTARWCATCQTNKKLVFSSQRVLRAFSARHVAALKADWTNQDPEITAALARFGRSAVPFNLLFLPGRDAPIILPPLLTPEIVLGALKP